VKEHLASKNKDVWDAYFPVGCYGYLEIPTASGKSLYDVYVLDSHGMGSNRPLSETNPVSIPFHGEKGDLLAGTYSFSREPVLQSRYFLEASSFFSESVVKLSDFILPKYEGNYKAWTTFIMQMKR